MERGMGGGSEGKRAGGRYREMERGMDVVRERWDKEGVREEGSEGKRDGERYRDMERGMVGVME